MVRCKLVLTEIAQVFPGGEKTRRVKFTAQYDASIPEDQRFWDSSPNAEFSVLVNNPVALEQLVLGQAYYLDLTPVPAPTPPPPS